MRICRDPLITSLAALGYSVVRHPRTDIEPLEVLYGSDPCERIGLLKDFWAGPEEVEPPTPTTGESSTINVRQTKKFGFTLGLGIMENLFAALGFGAVAPTIGANVRHTSGVTFTVPSPEVYGVLPARLDPILAEGAPRHSGPFFRALVDQPQGLLTIVTEVLRAKALVVQFESDDAADLAVEVKAAAEALSATSTGTVESTKAGSITFKSQSPAIFAFRSRGLYFEDGKWVALASDKTDFRRIYLSADGDTRSSHALGPWVDMSAHRMST